MVVIAGLHHDVPDPGRAQPRVVVVAIDVQLDVEPVVSQQHARELSGTLPVPGELPGVREPRPRAAGEEGLERDSVPSASRAPTAFAEGVADHVRVRAVRERCNLVQEVGSPMR